jgi:hypothetical protein
MGLHLLNRTASTVLKLVEPVAGAEFLRDVAEFVTGLADAFDIFRSRAEEVMHVLRGEATSFLLITGTDRSTLEEASFFVTLVPAGDRSRAVRADLVGMAEIAVKASQELLRALHAAQYIQKGCSREEMQDFLEPVDRVLTLEREEDEALRKTEKTIIKESSDHKELWVHFEIARIIEESTNSFMKAVHVMRDYILESVNR